MYHFRPPLSLVKDEWEYIPKNSGFRRLLLDMFATARHLDDFDAKADDMPQSFLAGLARIWMTTRSGLPKDRFPQRRPKGFYHDQEDEVSPKKPEAKDETRTSEL
jgi:hypothetical protein